MPEVDRVTFQCSRPGIFFGGDAAWGPENIIWAVAHGHKAAISIHNYCQGIPITERPPEGITLLSQKMGHHEWSYSNDYDFLKRRDVPLVELKKRLRSLKTEVELGFDEQLAMKEAERCLNCDIQTHFTTKLCIECDACIDVCPTQCLTITENREEEDLRKVLSAPALNTDQALYVSDALPQTGKVMVKDEDVCIHCGLCSERCPTAAFDMLKSILDIPVLGVKACGATAHV